MPLYFMPRGNKYYNQFIRLPAYKRMFIFLFFATCVTGAWLTLMYFRIQNCIDFYTLQKQNLDNKINLIQCSANQTNTLSKNIETNNALLTQYKRSNTQDHDLTFVIKQAKKLEITITNCSTKNKHCEKSWYTQNNVAITILGSLASIQSFFKTIDSVYVCGYSPCTISHSHDAVFQASCTLTFLTMQDDITTIQPKKLLTEMYDETNQKMEMKTVTI